MNQLGLRNYFPQGLDSRLVPSVNQAVGSLLGQSDEVVVDYFYFLSVHHVQDVAVQVAEVVFVAFVVIFGTKHPVEFELFNCAHQKFCGLHSHLVFVDPSHVLPKLFKQLAIDWRQVSHEAHPHKKGFHCCLIKQGFTSCGFCEIGLENLEQNLIRLVAHRRHCSSTRS